MVSRNVPYFSFSMAPEDLKTNWKNALGSVVDTGVFIGGPQVLEFETEFSRFLGVQESVGVGNGLDGLTIALKALGIGKGHLVAVPAHTFIACWLAIDIVGATAIGIDVDECGLIDLNKLKKLSIEIDAVMPVHLHGAMVDMRELMTWASEKQIKVIEDASQAHGALQDGKYAGTWGDAGVFSLYPSKNLGAAGDAGIIIFRDSANSVIARSIRSYGSNPQNKYDHRILGMNSRLDPIQAAILSVNLPLLNNWNEKRNVLGQRYSLRLSGTFRILQDESHNSIRHHYPILVSNPTESIEYLNNFGIGVERHYPELAAKAYNRLRDLPGQSFAIAEAISTRTISLPISQWHTLEDVDYVCDILLAGNEEGVIRI